MQLTDTSPCLRNVMPFVRARALDLLSIYDVESKCFATLADTQVMTLNVWPDLGSFSGCAVQYAFIHYADLLRLMA
jgi:hypothetical protein